MVLDVIIPPCCAIMQKPGEGLLVELDERRVGRPTSGAAVAAQWFAQDLFDGADLEEEEEQTLPAASNKQRKAAKQTAEPKGKAGQQSQAAKQSQQPELAVPKAALAAADDAASSEEDSDSADGSEGSSSDDDTDALPTAGPSSDADAQLMGKSGFEEVPISRRHADGAGSSDDSSDDGFDDLDDDGKAEVLALAKKMLNGRDRQDIMDAAYHRYAFHESGMPRWFEEDEARHMK